ncbi:MAG: hypothetical protein KGJ78_05030 [Alphaproteobacteria bacterium]|nr:hypothetical protein [Alphaproteobacteria bacterium]
MSIISGLVDAHHELELSPSSRLVKSSWLARHLGVILMIGLAVALFFLFT